MGKEWRKPTLSAFRRACSSSRAACFSLSSTRVKDMPVLAREETALESVLALNGRRNSNQTVVFFFFFVDNCYAAKTLSTGILTFLKIIKIKHTCLLLLNLWLSSPLERPSAAPGHPVSCWGPGVNVSHTLHLMSPKCHVCFFFLRKRKINIKACQDCTNRATPQYADGERKGLNTYTNCKLKMEQ